MIGQIMDPMIIEAKFQVFFFFFCCFKVKFQLIQGHLSLGGLGSNVSPCDQSKEKSP